MENDFQADLDAILSKQRVNGGEFWSSTDGGIAKGGPFSTLDVGVMLSEIGYDRKSPEIRGIASLILGRTRPDGRIKVYPSGSMYPCQTANAARTLCYLGYSDDPRLDGTYTYLLANQHVDGGWRCNSFKYGRGPETEFSNSGTTLTVLDVFRFTSHLNTEKKLDDAVESLLRHWETRLPLGPCHYGIGSLFMKIEYPMFRYNIFHYAYTLSFYDRAKKDPRFLDAVSTITDRLTNGQIVVESTNRKLADLEFCKLHAPSLLATKRYNEILRNCKSPISISTEKDG